MSTQTTLEEEDQGAPRHHCTHGPRGTQTPLDQEDSGTPRHDGTKKNKETPDTFGPKDLSLLPIRARTWKQPRCPSTEEWIRKMWYIYTMEYYAAEKNNDIMKFAGKWMELENVILSEVSHTKVKSRPDK
ncbi:hypothetical protein STEG23_032580 [Scotinomys teguina]